MITASVDGQDFTGLLEAEVTKSLDNFCNKFFISYSALQGSVFPIKRGSKIELKADGKLLMTGYAEKINIDYTSDSHALSCEGRSISCDLVDSTADGAFEYNPPLTLKQLVEKVLKQYGFSDMEVLDEAGSVKPFKKTDQISSEIGTSIFEIIESYCRSRQVLAITNEEGNIVLLRTQTPEMAGVNLIHNIDSPLNNILAAKARFDDTERFAKYNVFSQGNASTLNTDGDVSNEDIATRISSATDSYPRAQRVLNITAERSSDVENLTNRSKWEANYRRAKSLEFEVRVFGHLKTQGGDPWKLHQLVPVSDIYANIEAQLLIKDLTFSYDSSKGSTTTIGLVAKDAFSLKAEQDAREQKSNKQGDDLAE